MVVAGHMVAGHVMAGYMGVARQGAWGWPGRAHGDMPGNCDRGLETLL